MLFGDSWTILMVYSQSTGLERLGVVWPVKQQEAIPGKQVPSQMTTESFIGPAHIFNKGRLGSIHCLGAPLL